MGNSNPINMKKNLFLLFLIITCLAGYSQETGTVTDPRDGKVYKTIKIGNQWIMAENLAYKPEKGVYWADTTYFDKDIIVKFKFDYSRFHFKNGKVRITIKSGDKFDMANFPAKIPTLNNSDATYGYLIFDSTKYFGKFHFDGYFVFDSAFFKRYRYLYDFETAQSSAIPGWHVPTNSEWKVFFKCLKGNAKDHYSSLTEGGSSGFNVVLSGWGLFTTNGLKARVGQEQRAGFWSSSKWLTLCDGLDFEGPPALNKGAVRIGGYPRNTGLSVRLFKDN